MAIRAQDTFTDTANTELQNHTPSPTGTAWQVNAVKTFTIGDVIANAVGDIDTVGIVAKETTDITTPNMLVEAVVQMADNKSESGLGPMTRIPSGNVNVTANQDGFAAMLLGNPDKTGADIVLFRLDNGVFTEIGTRFNANVANDTAVTIRIESDSANVHKVFQNGTLRITQTDAAHSTNQFAGIGANDDASNSSLDNYRSEDIGGVAAILQATPSMSLVSAAALTTAIEMAAVAPMSLVAAAALELPIEMAAAPAMSLVSASALQTAIEMAAVVPMSLVSAAALQTAIEMAAAAPMSLNAVAALTAEADTTMAATPSMSLVSAALLQTAIEMRAAPVMESINVAALQTAIEMAATAPMSLVDAAALQTAIEMAATPVASLVSAAALQTAIQMNATPAMNLVTAAALQTAIEMTATPSMSLISTANLATAIEMAAIANMTLNVAPALTAVENKEVAATPSMSLNSVAALQTAIQMAASGNMSLISASALQTAITMAATPSMSLNVTPALTTAIELAAAITMSLNAAADLEAGNAIAAAASMSLSANAALQTAIEMAASGTLTLNAAAILTTQIELAVLNAMSLTGAAALTTAIDLSAAPSLSLIISPTLVVPSGILGGIFNAVSQFAISSTVTIELKDPITGAVIPLLSAVCNEFAGTGIFIWDGINLTTPVTGYQEYAWRMTDGTNFNSGVIRMFDSADSTKLLEIWRRLALDSANPLTNKDDGGIEATDIDIVASKSGKDIIQTRS